MGLSLLFFPLWIIFFVFLLIIFAFIVWIWAIIDCLTSRLTTAEKLFWVIVILLFHIIGVILYFVFSRMSGKSMVKTKNFKGKKLLRSKKNRVIAGVCAGIGEYLGMDPTIIRLLWVIFIFLSFGAAILAYIIAWIIIPEGK